MTREQFNEAKPLFEKLDDTRRLHLRAKLGGFLTQDPYLPCEAANMANRALMDYFAGIIHDTEDAIAAIGKPHKPRKD